MKKLYLILYCLFFIVACETFTEIKTQPKPRNNSEAIVYAYGQVYIVKEALAYVYANPDGIKTNIDKAVTGMIADKVGAMQQKALASLMEQLQSGSITQQEALSQVRKQSDAYSRMSSDNPRFQYVQSLVTDIESALDLINLASGTVGVVTECVIRIENLPPLPCTSKSDYLLLVLLQAQRAQ